jgi:hypothetical protein
VQEVYPFVASSNYAISFDFSFTFIWPSTMRCRAAKAETMWIASFALDRHHVEQPNYALAT